VSIDDARAMVSIENGVVVLIKQIAPKVVSIHCAIHREVLVAKKLGNEDENCPRANVI